MARRRAPHFHRVMTLLALGAGAATGGFPSAVAGPAPMATPDCVAELVQFMEWAPGFRRLLWNEPEPFRADWRRVSSASQSRVGEFVLGFCELELKGEAQEELRRRFRFRPLALQLKSAFERWDAEPARELPEYSFAVLLMESRPGAQATLAPAVIQAVSDFLRERGSVALSDAVGEADIALAQVLSRRFLEVSYAPGPGRSRARVLASHRLQIRSWPAPSELLFVLFHELSHVSEARAERFARWSRPAVDQEDGEDWVALGVIEEFRARALSARFEAAWKRRFPQYGSAQEVSRREIWDRLRAELNPVLPEQARAYNEFFRAWDEKPAPEQNALLEAYSSGK